MIFLWIALFILFCMQCRSWRIQRRMQKRIYKLQEIVKKLQQNQYSQTQRYELDELHEFKKTVPSNNHDETKKSSRNAETAEVCLDGKPTQQPPLEVVLVDNEDVQGIKNEQEQVKLKEEI